ncbi:Permease of the drug/metabolite transporter (DMT) superfamily [Mesobacillus persicus]|uniref:Permease of the drug/metabolite transporter (DMT) superfamily n=1 Tax=Mesobacillus persicus TaxID=930146 RepID=A0A1H7YZ30_9BACI|nr:DMT family transporter [Mesobacillus persicus]SEM51396.1 Permease of the drug/metabolite transporter (DMT) superfamily [Mesobacillus persicus]
MKLKSLFQDKWGVFGIAIICTLLWGSAFPVLKLSNTELQIAANDPVAQIVFAGMRFLLAGLILLTFLFVTNRRQLIVKRSHLLILILFGTIQTAVQYYFFYIGLSNVSGMQGAILSSSGIFLAVILAHFYYKNDHMNWKKSVGILAGFAGIIIANWGKEFQFDFQLAGEGYMILAGLTSAVATIMTKELATGISPVTLTGWQLTIGATLLLIIGVPQLSENAIIFTGVGWGLLIYAAFLSSIAFALWTSVLKYNKAGEVSIYNFLTPVFGTILSAWLVPGESLNLMVIAAIGFVAFGIIIMNMNYSKKQIAPAGPVIKQKIS